MVAAVAGISKAGTALLVSACVILAVRTARWPAKHGRGTESDRELDVKVEHAIHLADRVFGMLLSQRASLFPQREQPWYVPTDEDSPK